MFVIPAIDLQNGRCVRLRQGSFDDVSVFSDSPVETARRWLEEGAKRLHLVDLDGALTGEPKQLEVIEQIVSAVDIPVQVGGGIRDLTRIADYINIGVQSVIIGTQAVKDPGFVDAACRVFPGRVIVGIDAKNGFVAIQGWSEVSDVSAIELATQFENMGVSEIIYTDIARDGMMQGVNIEQTRLLAESVSIPVIASGGVHSLEDINQLLQVGGSDITGVIVGRSLYENSLSLVEALALVANHEA